MDHRRHDITATYRKTCKWLLKTPEWVRWRDGTEIARHREAHEDLRSESDDETASNISEQSTKLSRLLWIRGNPGSGKSTMMKFAINQLEMSAQLSEERIVSHFFNARGGALEKSIEGLYRTLLVHLLEDVPLSRFDGSNVSPIIRRAIREESLLDVGQVPRLLELLREVIRIFDSAGSPVTIFVDALDECDSKDIQKMVDSFSELLENSAAQLHICFASRYFPHVSLFGTTNIGLENHDAHFQDVREYIRGQLRRSNINIREDLQDRLQKKAAGSFIWAYVVIALLKDVFNKGNTMDLEASIESLPTELRDVYSRILKQSQGDHHQSAVCFRWILLAGRPLSTDQLWWAIHLESVSHENYRQVAETYRLTTYNDIWRNILQLSRGLVSVTESSREVQFIHETVREFLLEETGLLDHGAAARGHEQLKRTLSSVLLAVYPLLSAMSKLHSDEAKALFVEENPLGQYACMQVLHHAEQAQRGRIDQSLFISHFKLTLADFDRLLRLWYGTFDQTTSLLWHLMNNDAGALMRHLQSEVGERGHRFGFDCSGNLYNSPLFNAIGREAHNAIASLLSMYLQRHTSQHICVRETLERLAKKASAYEYETRRESRFVVHYKDELFKVALMTDKLAAFFLLALAPLETLSPEAIHNMQGDTLHDFTSTLEFLLRHNVAPGPSSFTATDALKWAAQEGNIRIAWLLIDTYKIELPAVAWRIFELLDLVIKRGHSELLDMFSNSLGLPLHFVDEYIGTLLHVAIRRDNLDDVKMLVKAGADVNTVDNDGNTVLDIAEATSCREIVAYLRGVAG